MVQYFVLFTPFVAITFDCYRKICKPLSFQTSQQRVWLVVIVIVCLGCASTWPAIVLFGESNISAGEGNFTYGVCNIDSAYQKTIYLTLFYGFYYVVFGVSFFYILVSYYKIWRQVKMHSNFNNRHTQIDPEYTGPEDRSKNTAIGQPKNRTTASAKITKMMFVVTLFFILSFVPHLTLIAFLFKIPNFRNQLTRLQYIMFEIGYRSPMINSASNSVIYTCMDTSYRTALTLLFWFRCSAKEGQNSTLHQQNGIWHL